MTAYHPHDAATAHILEYIRGGLGVCDAFDRRRAARENVHEARLCRAHAATARRDGHAALARVYRRQAALYLAYARAWLTPTDA